MSTTPIYCQDHDGFREPVTRRVLAWHPEVIGRVQTALDFHLCAYCAEVKIASLLRDGYEVQVRPTGPEASQRQDAPLLHGDLADDDGDAPVDPKPLLVTRFDDPDPIAATLHRIADRITEGGDFLVLTEPDLVAAVLKLLTHQVSPSSVDDNPEGTPTPTPDGVGPQGARSLPRDGHPASTCYANYGGCDCRRHRP